jgi:hypothetical protein
MKNRRSFLATVVSGGTALALAKAEPAVAQSSPSPAPSPSGKPAPSPSAKPATAASLAIAATFRKFDGALSDDDLQTIARAVDANNDAARSLNPKKKRLANGAAPAVHFAAAGKDG